MFQRKAIVWFVAAKDKARFAFGFNILLRFSSASGDKEPIPGKFETELKVF